MRPTRPVIRFHGGKWRLAPWILEFFPPHRTYVEPFGGAASVLLRKPRARCEIYNDLDRSVVGLFRVLRDPAQASELVRRLELTPYSRVEHDDAYEPTPDPIEQARYVIVRGMMGHGSRGATSPHRTGFRSATRRGVHAAAEWSRYPIHLRRAIERLAGVLIECRDAEAVIREYDGEDCLHYVDPPYLPETRTTPLTGAHRAYQHELSVADHFSLADQLHAVRGMVIISGYPSALYDQELFPGWERHETRSLADGRISRIEVIWLNPACSQALRRSAPQGDLLAAGGAS